MADQSLQKAPRAQPQDAVEAWVQSPVTALLKKHRDVIEIVAKGVLDEQRVMRLIRAAILRDQNILNCTPISVLNAVLHVTYLGLEVAPEQAYLLAFKDRRSNKTVCTPIIDYRGKIRVAANAGIIFDDPQIIYKNEKFAFFTDDTGTHFRHDPMIDGTDEDRGRPIAAYVVTRSAGIAKITLMRRDEIMAIRTAALSRMSNGPWVDHEMRMWAKTVCHRAFKTLPRPTDNDIADRMRRTQEIDDANDMAMLPEAIIVDHEAEMAPPMIPENGTHEQQEAVAAQKIETLIETAKASPDEGMRGTAERYEQQAEAQRGKMVAEAKTAEAKAETSPKFSFGRKP